MTTNDTQRYSPLEAELNERIRTEAILLHGSTRPKPGRNVILPGRRGEVYATNLACVAILKALFSNRECENLGYPYYPTNRKDGFVLTIRGMTPETAKEEGYIYVITDTSRFVNNPQSIGSWEYIARGRPVEFTEVIKVVKADFVHPIFDEDAKRWVQK